MQPRKCTSCRAVGARPDHAAASCPHRVRGQLQSGRLTAPGRANTSAGHCTRTHTPCGEEVAGTFGTALCGSGAPNIPRQSRDSDGNRTRQGHRGRCADSPGGRPVPDGQRASRVIAKITGRVVWRVWARRKQVADTQARGWLAAYSFCEGFVSLETSLSVSLETSLGGSYVNARNFGDTGH